MENVREQLVQATDNFIATITRLTQQHAAQTFQGAFAQLGTAQGGELPASRASKAKTGSNGHTAAAPAPDSGSRAPKRSPDELEKLSKRFVQYVSAHPGLRIEQINKELGTSTAELALPIRKLIADKVLTVKGQKRSTAYFIKGGAASAPSVSAEGTEAAEAAPKGRSKKRSSGGKRSGGKSRAKKA